MQDKKMNLSERMITTGYLAWMLWNSNHSCKKCQGKYYRYYVVAGGIMSNTPRYKMRIKMDTD